eukprot:jgi/Mesvir1/6156/Mv00854-RA.1
MASRPEQQNPPEIFYNEVEARKYTTSSRIIEIQDRLTNRALELLALPQDGKPRLLLDLGCGSGLSGDCLTEAGHHWIGMDISPSMLDVAKEREVEGDLLLADIGQGIKVRPGMFDGAISISCVQWLCNADTSRADPRKRLKAFFSSLYACLARGAKAVLQFYPDGAKQAEMIAGAAMKAGFSGGVLVDYPNSTRAKKYFLVLMVGPPSAMPRAKGLDGESGSEDEAEGSDGEGGVAVAGRERGNKRQKTGSGNMSVRQKVFKVKDRQRRKGNMDVRADTKYTGRKRGPRF